MKNIIRWLFVYGVYWFVVALTCDSLYEKGIDLNYILEDIIRIFLPLILVLITYAIHRVKRKQQLKNDANLKVDSMPVVDRALKVCGIIVFGFVIALVLIHIYMFLIMN